MSDPYDGGPWVPLEDRLDTHLEALESHLAALVCVMRELVQVERYRAELERWEATQLGPDPDYPDDRPPEIPWKNRTKGA